MQKIYRRITLMLLVTAFIFMTVILYSFSNQINIPQAELGRNRLQEVIIQNVTFVNLTMGDKVDFMESVAIDIGSHQDLRSAETMEHLSRLSQKTGFSRIAIDFLDGKSYTSDGHVVDYGDLNYIDDIIKGEPFITDMFAAKLDGRSCISIVVPIIRDGVVIAGARGTIYTQDFGQMLGVKIFDGEGYFHLLNTDGEYLAVSDSENSLLMDENYFDAIDKLEYDEGYSAKRIKEDMVAGLAGSTSYSYQSNERYVEYMPVGINDWYLMIIVPKWVIDRNALVIQQDVLRLVVKLSTIALAVFLFILFSMKSAQNEIRKINEKLAVGEERYRFMLERSDNVIFEYTLENGAIAYSEKFAERFGYIPTARGLPFSIIESQGVYPEDAGMLMTLFEDVRLGKKSTDAELRIRQADGAYLWCSISAVSILGEDGQPIKAMGVIENIDQKKKKELALITKAEKDQLTDLYNKTTTENLIKDFLNSSDNRSSSHALMIIDIDNFKDINDKLGHLYGDVVLTKLANSLKPILRDTDVVGRIGGDEFFVFMKRISSDVLAIQKAREICSIFRRTYSEDAITCQISASIGIAIYPQHGEEFETLYKNADMALYTTKACGKDSYSIFSGGALPSYTSQRTEIVSAGMAHQKSFQDNKIEYLFKLLYATKDDVSAVHNALCLLADYFGFSSSYIFEEDTEVGTMVNTFDWCAPNIPSVPDNLRHLKSDNFSTIWEALDRDNLFIISNMDAITPEERALLEPTGVRSLYLFGIRQLDRLVGFIGFDDCLRERCPSVDEVDEMMTVCNVLSTFLLKKRALDKAQSSYAALSKLMSQTDEQVSRITL